MGIVRLGGKETHGGQTPRGAVCWVVMGSYILSSNPDIMGMEQDYYTLQNFVADCMSGHLPGSVLPQCCWT